MWFWLALSFAFWNSISVVIAKKILKTTDVFVFIAFGNLVFVPFMVLVLFFQGFPKIDQTFLINIFSAIFLGIFVQLSYIKAIKIAPISLVVPMAALTPVVATIFGFIYLGEVFTALKLVGIFLVVSGAYLLNIKDIKKGLLEPIKALLRNRGVQLSLLGNFLVGITPIFEKKAIFHTSPNSPLMALLFEDLFFAIIFLPIALKNFNKAFSQFKINFWLFVLPVPFGLFASWAAFKAYSLTNLGYATAIFKISIIFGIIWGWLFFKEKDINERLLGAFVMLVGTILLVI